MNTAKVVRIDEVQEGWSYDVILSDGTRRYVYAKVMAWGVVWHQNGLDSGYVQINRDGRQSRNFCTNLIEIVLEQLAARRMAAIPIEVTSEAVPASTCNAPTPESAAPEAKKRASGRCPVREIRRFWAIALDLGYDIKNKDAARAAIGGY